MTPLERWFREFFKRYKTLEITADFNAGGFPPDNLTWELATEIYPINHICRSFRGDGYFRHYNPPDSCKECGSPLEEKGHDLWDIEGSGQYMVYTYTCPNGHGHYGEYA